MQRMVHHSIGWQTVSDSPWESKMSQFLQHILLIFLVLNGKSEKEENGTKARIQRHFLFPACTAIYAHNFEQKPSDETEILNIK